MAEFLPAEPFDLVIFGGTGDLSQRKLLPALFHRDRDQQFSDDSRIFASARGNMSRTDFVELVRKALEQFLPAEDFDKQTWERFSGRLHFHRQDVTSAEGWSDLKDALGSEPGRLRVFYLATMPALFGSTATQLKKAGLVYLRDAYYYKANLNFFQIDRADWEAHHR